MDEKDTTPSAASNPPKNDGVKQRGGWPEPFTADEIARFKIRSKTEIAGEMRRCESQVWFERNRLLEKMGSIPTEKMEMFRRGLAKEYGPDFEKSWRSTEDCIDYDWGFLSGWLTALRWVLGDRKDNLSTVGRRL
jgi:hypothetical protein